jgi:hypothetical protein
MWLKIQMVVFNLIYLLDHWLSFSSISKIKGKSCCFAAECISFLNINLLAYVFDSQINHLYYKNKQIRHPKEGHNEPALCQPPPCNQHTKIVAHIIKCVFWVQTLLKGNMIGWYWRSCSISNNKGHLSGNCECWDDYHHIYKIALNIKYEQLTENKSLPCLTKLIYYLK